MLLKPAKGFGQVVTSKLFSVEAGFRGPVVSQGTVAVSEARETGRSGRRSTCRFRFSDEPDLSVRGW